MEKERVVELALDALQKQRLAVEDEIRELSAQLKGGNHNRAMLLTTGERRAKTAAERRAHSRAMKAYWQRKKTVATEPRPKSGPQSAAARKAVSERMKAYWAKRKAQATKPAASRKPATAKAQQTTAARKAQSERMKEIWAKRKAESAKKGK